MKKSENFDLYLPNRDDPEDFADVNQLSANFASLDKIVFDNLKSIESIEENVEQIETEFEGTRDDVTMLASELTHAKEEIDRKISGTKVYLIDEDSTDEEIPSARSVYNLKKNSEANVANPLKKALGGNPILIDDASPLEHEMAVGIKSKNLANVDAMLNANLIKDENGVYRITKDGSAVFRFDETIPANTPFVISYENFEGYNANSDAYIYNAIYFADGTSQGGSWCGQGKFSNNIVVNPGKDVKGFAIYMYNPSADAYCSFTGVQVELGTTATAYTPYVDVNGATVKKYGKNLLNQDALYRANIFYEQDDGRWFFGKVNGSYVSTEAKLTIPANTNFTCSFEGVDVSNAPATSNGDFVQLQIYFTDGSSSYPGFSKSAIEANGKVSITKYYEKQVRGVRFSYPSVTQDGNYITFDSFQIEIGTTTTEFEPYKEPIPYTADENGIVKGIVGNGEAMTLFADEGITIHAEYNRDLNKAFAEIYQAIATMGAAVAVIPEEV